MLQLTRRCNFHCAEENLCCVVLCIKPNKTNPTYASKHSGARVHRLQHRDIESIHNITSYALTFKHVPYKCCRQLNQSLEFAVVTTTMILSKRCWCYFDLKCCVWGRLWFCRRALINVTGNCSVVKPKLNVKTMRTIIFDQCADILHVSNEVCIIAWHNWAAAANNDDDDDSKDTANSICCYITRDRFLVIFLLHMLTLLCSTDADSDGWGGPDGIEA